MRSARGIEYRGYDGAQAQGEVESARECARVRAGAGAARAQPSPLRSYVSFRDLMFPTAPMPRQRQREAAMRRARGVECSRQAVQRGARYRSSQAGSRARGDER